jgi:hypothetical protein
MFPRRRSALRTRLLSLKNREFDKFKYDSSPFQRKTGYINSDPDGTIADVLREVSTPIADIAYFFETLT